MKKSAAVVLLVLAVLAASCNGDGGDTDPTTTSDGTPTTDETPTTDQTPTTDETPTTDSLPDEETSFDLLMAATFGDTESFDRIAEPAVWDWRARGEVGIPADYANPPPDFAECMEAGVEEQLTFFNFQQVVAVRDGEFAILPLESQRGNERIDLESFIAEVNGIQAENPDAAIGLDFFLAPSMKYGVGADDPTAVLDSAVSEVLSMGSTDLGSGATIWIADYGLPVDSDESNWPVKEDGSPTITGDRTQPLPSGLVTPQYGHGLMVASVAAQLAPSASVEVIDVAGSNGVITVSSIADALTSAGILNKEGVLNLSIGSYTCAIEGLSIDIDSAFEAVMRPYIEAPQIAVVAAGGNDATDQPFLPASFGGVIAVGAFDTTVRNTEECLADPAVEAWSPGNAAGSGCEPDSSVLAPFSNHGSNAEVARPGVDLVVDYPTTGIRYRYINDAEDDLGAKVRTSGTSLAAPFHSACLVAANPACDQLLPDPQPPSG